MADAIGAPAVVDKTYVHDVAPLPVWRRTINRPEFGALISILLVFALFSGLAGSQGFLTLSGTLNYVQVAAELGIMVVPITLLMMAGEFDLTVGSVVGAASVILAYLTTVQQWTPWLAVVVTLISCAALGFLNGFVVVKTRLPAFVVTLAGLFAIRGAAIALTLQIAGNTLIENVPRTGTIQSLFAGRVGTFPVSIVWWLALVAIAVYVLANTRFGNWIVGTGGGGETARRLGVPTSRVKIALFVMTATSAAIVGIIQTFTFGSGDSNRGVGFEFETIAAAVIGGTLLSGGFGSAIGAALGALVFGMISQGLYFTSIDGNWFSFILGLMLGGAAWINHTVRERTVGVRTT
jgi:simple sugar transport system permease protein